MGPMLFQVGSWMGARMGPILYKLGQPDAVNVSRQSMWYAYMNFAVLTVVVVSVAEGHRQTPVQGSMQSKAC